MTSCTHLLYLHGFRSSPKSAKALRMARWMREQRPELHFECPQLPPSPAEAIALIERLSADWDAPNMAVMGSSLGGFYATALAERRGCRAVLLNPAVDPARDLAGYIGEQSCWQSPEDRFFFRAEFIAELRALTQGPLIEAQRYGVVIAKGDELLDWREMQARYSGAHIKLLEGSDHGLSDFENHISFVTEHLGL